MLTDLPIALRSRLKLALNLASTLFQLFTTPWLGLEGWSKESISFVSSSGEPQARVIPSKIDLSRPLLTHSFANPRAPSHPLGPPSLSPRDALLTLGLMLLELWNEMPFENYVGSQHDQTNMDYLARASFAERWLESSEDDMIPDYHALTWRCIRCQFDGVTIKPSWEDESLRKGLIESVIEPLQALCHKKPGHNLV